MKFLNRRRLLSVLAFIYLNASLLADNQDEAELNFKTVQAYADAMLEYGTDTYGAQKSPLLISILERKPVRAFSRMPQPPNGIRQGDRVTTHGANVNLDQNLYRVLYALSQITGDSRYQSAADNALQSFLKVSPSSETHLFAWGEHLCWDLKTDAPGTHESKQIHEPKRPTVLFDQFYKLNPAATIKYCDGLWEHQLYTDKNGKKDGNFSRHAAYARHDPRANYDFPKEGGYFIHDWEIVRIMISPRKGAISFTTGPALMKKQRNLDFWTTSLFLRIDISANWTSTRIT